MLEGEYVARALVMNAAYAPRDYQFANASYTPSRSLGILSLSLSAATSLELHARVIR